MMLVGIMGLASALQPGTYAMRIDMVTETKVPVVGHTKVLTRSDLLVQLIDGPDGWSQSQQTCAVTVSSPGPARTVMPPAFLASLPVQRFAVVNEGGRYVADGGPVTVGAEPLGPLPTTLDDPRALDTDRDGHPGATVWLEVPVLGRVELFIAQRAHSVLEGHPVGDGAQGDVRVVAMEQHTLGATRSMFNTSPAMRAVPEASGFWMRPLPAGAGCDDVSRLAAPE